MKQRYAVALYGLCFWALSFLDVIQAQQQIAVTAGTPVTTMDQCVFDVDSPVAGALHYDLNSIHSSTAHEKDIQVGPTIQFQYRVNICGNVDQVCQNKPSLATETLIIPAGQSCRNLGTLGPEMATYTLVPAYIQDRSRNPYGLDLQLTYYGGDQCQDDEDSPSSTGESHSRSVSMQLACDTTLPAGDVNIVDVKKESECSTTFVLATSQGCANLDGGSPSKTLVYGVTAAIIYCAVGIGINRLYRKKEWGREIVPHLAFWLDFPGLVKDGCAFSYEMFQACREKGVRQALRDEWAGESDSSGGFGSGGAPHGA